MQNGDDINWKNWISVDRMELEKQLIIEAENEEEENLYYRVFSINIFGNSINDESLISYIKEQSIKFIFTEKDIVEFEEDGIDPLSEALAKFGDVDPLSDGKYGELLLYILTEAILETPMIVQKLSFTYPNNQAHGSDGIFMGRYKDKSALLIGESKMRQQYSICLSNAIDSIERFHNDDEYLRQELLISKKQLRNDLSSEDLDFIYKSMKHGSDEFNTNVLVHPILLMYREKEIKDIIDKASSDMQLKSSLLEIINKRLEKRIKSIKNNSVELRKKERVYLDFFLIPVSDMNEFREKCYAAFHGGNRFLRT